MKQYDVPFNIRLLQLEASRLKTLRPVKTSDIMEIGGQTVDVSPYQDTAVWNLKTPPPEDQLGFNADGLFSIDIFGRLGDAQRDRQFSYIDIKTDVFHPLIYRVLGKLKQNYHDILAGRLTACWDPELKDFEVCKDIDGDTGYQYFVSHWQDINFRHTGSHKRELMIQLIEKYRTTAMTSKIMVLPAGLRDVRAGSRRNLEFDPINDVYRRIINISRGISKWDTATDQRAANYTRYQLQLGFNEIYDYFEALLKGKTGFIQKKWASRRIFNGGRNVISSMDTSKAVLGEIGGPRVTDTILGLFQVIKGALPLTLHLLRTGYIANNFSIGDSSSQVKLIDPKTLQSVMVEVPSALKDQWTTLDGLEKLINSYAITDQRHEPVMVDEFYLGLIYLGPDKTFRVFYDIRDLPEHLDKANVKPLSLIELLYLSGYRRWNTLKVIVTRYPVTNIGSTYPSDIYTKTTVVGEVRRELGLDWEPLGPEYTAFEFPKLEPLAFVDSQIISPVRIDNEKGLNADYDGDTCNGIIVYSEDALEEINRVLHSRETYITADNELRLVNDTTIVKLLLRNMTGLYPTMDY